MADKNITKNGTGTLAFNNHVQGNVDLQGGKLIIGDTNQNKNAYKIHYGGNFQVKKFLECLYKDSTIYLDRKYEKYKKITKYIER